MPKTVQIFISSPGDVGQERVIAERVIERLKGEFGGWVMLQAILWEHEPVRATSTFQEQIVRPSETDIVVCILWSRLGTRLPEGFERRPDGTSYKSGTSFEFEDAQRAFDERGVPDLLVYRKTAEPMVSLRDPARLHQQQEQWTALETYLKHWFCNQDGSFKAGFNQFATADEFEQLFECHLRELISNKLEMTEAAVSEQSHIKPWWLKDSPFRGLKPFEFEHAPVFFGRTRAIGEIREALSLQAVRGWPFVLIFGMSGCGKSSLVRAGVLPILIQPGVIEGIGLWRQCQFRPSDAAGDLNEALVRRLVSEGALPELLAAGGNVEELVQAFNSAPGQAVPILRMGLHRAAESVTEREKLTKPPESRLALLIDQMEELFTLDWVDDAARERFLVLLSNLAESGLIWIVATMRSDFYQRCAEHPTLAMLSKDQGQYHLLPPQRAEIAQMIRQPALAAGLGFEINQATEIDLASDIEEAAARDPAALPLLEFTLDELYQAASRAKTRVLTFESYKTLGGLEGSLAKRAEATFANLAPTVREVLPAVLTALVTVDPRDRKPASARRAPLISVSSTPDSKALVDAFVKARLLVTDRTEEGIAVVRVAHEALFEHWPRLQEWLRQNREFLRIRTRVEEAATQWQHEYKDSAYLVTKGKPLAEAEELLERQYLELSGSVTEFIEASIAKARLGQRRLRIFAGIAIALALIAGSGAYLGFIGQQKAEEQATIAQSTQAEGHYILSNLESEEHIDSVKGFLLATSALEAVPEVDSSLDIYARRIEQLALTLPRAFKLDTDIAKAVFTRNLDKLATISANGKVRITDLATGRPIKVPTLTSESPVTLPNHTTPAFSPDGKLFAAGTDMETGRYWDIETGRSESFPSPLARPIWGDVQSRFYFSPNGDAMLWFVQLHATIYSKATWVLDSGTPGSTEALGFKRHAWSRNPERNWAVVGSSGGTYLNVIDVTTGKPVAENIGPTSENGWPSIRLSPGADWIVSSSYVESEKKYGLRLWRAQDGRPLDVVAKRSEFPLEIQDISRDGRKVLTFSSADGLEGKLQLWDFNTPEPYPHGYWELGAITQMESRWLKLAGDQTGMAFCGDDSLAMGVFSPKQFIRSNLSPELNNQADKHIIRFWDLRTKTELPKPIYAPGELIAWGASPSCKTLATLSKDGSIMVWTLPGDQPESMLPASRNLQAQGPYSAAWLTPNGQAVITAKASSGLLYSGGMPSKDGDRRSMLQMWSIRDGAPMWDEPISVVWDYVENVPILRFGENGKQFVTMTALGKARGHIKSSIQMQIWNAETRTRVTPNTVTVQGELVDAALTSDGRWLTAAYAEFPLGRRQYVVQRWDVASGKPMLRHTIENPGNKKNFRLFGLSRNSQQYLAGSSDQQYREEVDWAQVRSIGVWDSETSTPLFSEVAFKRESVSPATLVFSVALSARRLTSNGGAGLIAEFPNASIPLRATPTGPTLGGLEGQPWVSTPSGSFDASFTPVISSDAKWIATLNANRRQVRVWSARTGLPSSEHILHESEVLAMAFNDTNDRLLTFTRKGALRSIYIGQARVKKSEWMTAMGEALTGMRLVAQNNVEWLSEEDLRFRRRVFFEALEAAIDDEDPGAQLIYTRWKSLAPENK